MNEKQTREIDLRQTAFSYAHEAALARANTGLAAGQGQVADAKTIIVEAKIIHEYLTKGK